MARTITQSKAKVLIRDYLRETGRKGVSSLMRDLSRHAGHVIFTQRTMEKWLEVQERQLNHDNWRIVLSFIESEQFLAHVAYENEGDADIRLKQVADGFVALYGTVKHPDGMYILPSQITAKGITAVRELGGRWANELASGHDEDTPHSFCKIEVVPDTRYAKFAYIALFPSRQISVTGLIIYINSDALPDHDYCHTFVLQLWRRRDPETGSNMPGELTYLTLAKNQPELTISNLLNRYFYKESDPIVSRGGVSFSVEPNEETGKSELVGKLEVNSKFRWTFNNSAGSKIRLYRKEADSPQKIESTIDQLLEDVLPHGYANT